MKKFHKFASALAVSVLACGFAQAGEKTIYGIFWEGCEHGCQGFLDEIENSGFDAEVLIRDANQDRDKLPGFVAEARDIGADLVLTYGTSVTLGVAGQMDDAEPEKFISRRPLVFMYVSDPFGSGIAESFDGSGRPHIAGTYNRVPEAVNIKTIRTIQPDFDHLGILFNLNERNSALKVKEMAELSEEMGFELTALEIDPGNQGVPDPALIAGKVAELAEAGVDFIYLGSSSFLRLNADVFTGAAVENGLPILSPYEEVVREQDALLSIAARAADVGALAAQQALKILRDGAQPGDLPIARVTDFAYVVNMDVANKLGMYPPIELLQIAEIVE